VIIASVACWLGASATTRCEIRPAPSGYSARATTAAVTKSTGTMLKGAWGAATMRSGTSAPLADSASTATNRMKPENRFAGLPPAVSGAVPTTMLGRNTRTSTPSRAPAPRSAVSASSFTRS